MTAATDRDLVVVSDLHLGRGRIRRTGRFHALETFFFDEDFRDLCRWLVTQAARGGTPFTLILNGDTFDLLRIEPEHTGPDEGRRERRFGASVTPEVAASIMGSILEGHPVWVAAVAEVLAAGHRVVLLPGNHDVELQWEAVQEQVRQTVGAELRRQLGEAGASAAALGRLEVRPWFYHEPGRIWVEHGNQYDPECSFHYHLRGRGVHGQWGPAALEGDMPLGNFFQRYLYNAFGSITFIVPSTRANRRYLRWLVWNRPRLLLRVAASHLPFMVQLLRRLALTPGRFEELEAVQRAQREELARTSGLGPTLGDIAALQHVPSKLTHAARALLSETARFLTLGLGLGVGALGLWFASFASIQQLDAGVGMKTLLFLAVQLLGASALIAAGGWRLLRTPRLRPLRPLGRAAGRLAQLLGVRVVTFGHTHEEVVAPLGAAAGAEALYFNTGTWVSTFAHEPLLPRERTQCTFLRMCGERAELLYWSPARQRPLPVVLFEEEGEGAPADVAAARPAAGVEPPQAGAPPRADAA